MKYEHTKDPQTIPLREVKVLDKIEVEGKTYIKVGFTEFVDEDGETVLSSTLFPPVPKDPTINNDTYDPTNLLVDTTHVENNRVERLPVTTYAVTRRPSTDFCEGDSYVMPQLGEHGYAIRHQKIVGVQVMEDMVLIESVPMPIPKGFHPLVTKFAILKDDSLISCYPEMKQ